MLSQISRGITRAGFQRFIPAYFQSTQSTTPSTPSGDHLKCGSKDFASAIKHRRTYYNISKDVIVPESRIREIVEYAVNWTPSSFNSQSSRTLILFGKEHDKFWDITKEILRA